MVDIGDCYECGEDAIQCARCPRCGEIICKECLDNGNHECEELPHVK